MTGQEADFDAGLDFNRFLLTGFFEAEVLRTARRISSSFIGFSEIGLALAIWSYWLLQNNTLLTAEPHSYIIHLFHFLPLVFGGRTLVGTLLFRWLISGQGSASEEEPE